MLILPHHLLSENPRIMSKQGKEEIREDIIREARQLFSKYGFRKTTMEDIAQATHKGKSSLYYYFPNKEEVFQAVIESEAAILRKALTDNTRGIQDAPKKLKEHIRIRMKTMKNLVGYYHEASHEHDIHYSFIEKLRETFDRDEVQTIREILDEGVSQGQFQPLDTSLAARALVTALKGLEYPLVWQNDKDDLENRIQKMTKLLFYGLLKR